MLLLLQSQLLLERLLQLHSFADLAVVVSNHAADRQGVALPAGGFAGRGVMSTATAAAAAMSTTTTGGADTAVMMMVCHSGVVLFES